MPQLHANLSKNGSIPSVNGGILWEDNINKRFYLFGGEFYQELPETLELLSYDTLNDQWDTLGSPPPNINRVSYGGGTSISERGEGYYYGGWMSNASIPEFGGDRVATTGLLRYTMDSNSWTNSSGPDDIPRAEGVMVYLPISDRGMLAYFGGVSMTPNAVGSPEMVGLPMSDIFLYDIAGGQWYNQTASGDVPEVRRRFCAGVTWAPDRSSFNMQDISHPLSWRLTDSLQIPLRRIWRSTKWCRIRRRLYPQHSIFHLDQVVSYGRRTGKSSRWLSLQRHQRRTNANYRRLVPAN